MRVLVCGGRDYMDGLTVDAVLDALAPTEIAHGGAKGADALAWQWAIARGVPCRVFRAEWHKYGAAAGPARNREMLREFRPDAVVAFPGGRGTSHMCQIAMAAGVPVLTKNKVLRSARHPEGSSTTGETHDG